jgi:atypical dual specificity phosphatase
MSRLDVSRLGPALLAGAMPYRREHVEALAGEGVTAVLNLCGEREYWVGERDELVSAYAEAGIVEHRLPVPDGATVPAAVLDDALRLARRRTVYVHCRGGRERSAVVAIALVAAEERLPVDEAARRVTSRRPTFAPLPWQLEALRAWVGGRDAAGVGE